LEIGSSQVVNIENNTSSNEKIGEDILQSVDNLDPLELIKCQLSESHVKGDGQLFLSAPGQNLSKKSGDKFELEVAKVLLELGIKKVRWGVTLKPPQGTQEDSEIDLLFICKGKLWLVDCKDKISDQLAMENLSRELNISGKIDGSLKNALKSIAGRLKINETKPLKEDVEVIARMGGLKGKIICARKESLSDLAQRFADSKKFVLLIKQVLLRI
jgi:hypothetical protein